MIEFSSLGFIGFLVGIAIICYFLLKKAIVWFPQWGWKDRFEAHSIHEIEKPRGGGIILAILFFASLPLFLAFDEKLIGFILGGIIVVGINFLDDRYKIPWWIRLVFELLGCLIVVHAGIEMNVLTNPFTNEALFLGVLLPWLPKLMTVIWILLFINMINWTDGVDGLASGISLITCLVLFELCMFPLVYQPMMGKVALVLAVLLAVFLKFNFFPAKIKLGDAGATFLGFSLAILAIFSSAKIATFFLVLGIPLLDMVWVVTRRIFIEKRSPMKGDKKHLHHRLLRLGLSAPQICYLLYTITAVLGVVAFSLQGATRKFIAILLMCLLTTIFFARVSYLERKKLKEDTSRR